VIRGAAPVEKAGEDAVLAVLSTGGNRKEQKLRGRQRDTARYRIRLKLKSEITKR
jgi:hypothetical protein